MLHVEQESFALICIPLPLTFRRMLESAVADGSENFGFQEEVAETGAVDRGVRSLQN